MAKKERVDPPSDFSQGIPGYMELLRQHATVYFPLATGENNILQTINQLATGTPEADKIAALNFAFPFTDPKHVKQAVATACTLNIARYMATEPQDRLLIFPYTYHAALEQIREEAYGRAPGQSKLVAQAIGNQSLGTTDYRVTLEYQGPVGTPPPMQSAIELGNKPHSKKSLIKAIREDIKSYGYAYGMMTAFYLGVPWVETLRSIFGDPNFAHDLQQSHYTNIPTINRYQDKVRLEHMYKLLSTYKYQEAVSVAQTNGWIPDSAAHVYAEKTVQNVSSRVVVELEGLSTHMVTQARSLGFPTETLYTQIRQAYGPIVTSHIRLAYIARLDEQIAAGTWMKLKGQ